MFAKYTSEKGFIFRIIKELREHSNRKPNNPIKNEQSVSIDISQKKNSPNSLNH